MLTQQLQEPVTEPAQEEDDDDNSIPLLECLPTAKSL
jgi:hypothetical protein